MAVKIQFKRGDTFILQCTLTDNLVPQDLTGWGIRAQVRLGALLVDELDLQIIDTVNGIYALKKEPAFTQLWPIKSLVCDIQYTTPTTQVTSTETFEINCKLDITLPP